MGLREWLIIVGVLLVVFIVLDGIRRMRRDRRDRIRMSLNKNFLNSGDPTDTQAELANSELPNGGARAVVQPSSPAPSAGDIDPEAVLPSLSAIDDAEPANIDLDQFVPMLMESVQTVDAEDQPPEFEASDDAETEIVTATDNSTDSVTNSSAPADTIESEAQHSLDFDAELPDESAATVDPDDQEVLIINVATKDQHFQGRELLQILLACDLRFGAMNIFHRHERAEGRGKVQFSMTNSIEPGTFDLDAIDHFTTPGVCFFMTVPGPDQPLDAFQAMFETAQYVAENLGGEMLDESRSAMTKQTLEHYRQRLRDFERRQLTHS